MDTIFMNSKNIKTSSDPHRLLINLADKIDLRRKYIALLNLSIYYKSKIIKKVI